MQEISAAKNAQRDMEISAGKYAARCCSKIAARYGNLGGQNAPTSRGDIAAKYGNLGGQFCGEVSVGVLLGFAMRTIFTFTLTINQTTKTMSYIAVPGIVIKIVVSLGCVLKLNYPLYSTVST